MPEDEKDLCPDCGSTRCICFAYGFGVSEIETRKLPVSDEGATPEKQVIPDTYDLC